MKTFKRESKEFQIRPGQKRSVFEDEKKKRSTQ